MSDVIMSDVTMSDVITSDVIRSDVIMSDVITSDVITSDVITSDVITSDVITKISTVQIMDIIKDCERCNTGYLYNHVFDPNLVDDDNSSLLHILCERGYKGIMTVIDHVNDNNNYDIARLLLHNPKVNTYHTVMGIT
jgi:hypothetical protein